MNAYGRVVQPDLGQEVHSVSVEMKSDDFAPPVIGKLEGATIECDTLKVLCSQFPTTGHKNVAQVGVCRENLLLMPSALAALISGIKDDVPRSIE
jgi:hypothetical protein